MAAVGYHIPDPRNQEFHSPKVTTAASGQAVGESLRLAPPRSRSARLITVAPWLSLGLSPALSPAPKRGKGMGIGIMGQPHEPMEEAGMSFPGQALS